MFQHELLSRLGHLNFAMCIITQGCPFISHPLMCVQREDNVPSTLESLFYNILVSSPVNVQLFTDAATSAGFEGVLPSSLVHVSVAPPICRAPPVLSPPPPASNIPVGKRMGF
ncbi:50S ribosomal protein L2 [Labeo rohita]|uniref:50S ribosomal protein L2 n=1 Tax=Labeo rohita TaxID=84645 RepID=A0ABQ8L6K8_LABRO|nr:50S ribosomal protein L2 [Labeo rohita]